MHTLKGTGIVLKDKAAMNQGCFSVTFSLSQKHGKVTQMEKHEHASLSSVLPIKPRVFHRWMISGISWLWS